MIKEYRLIVQDYFKELKLNKVYKIKDNRYIVSDADDSIKLYSVTKWQLENMFEEVK